MEKSDKYGKRSLSDFLRYRKDDLTGKERNAFEKELQKDPFAEEAAEGFSSVTDKEVLQDLSSLRRKLDKRTGKRSATIPYRIAAALAILVAISVIFYNKNNIQEPSISKNEPEKAKIPMEIAVSEPIIDKTEVKTDTVSINKPVPEPFKPSVATSEAERLAVNTRDIKETDRIVETNDEKAVAKDSELPFKDLASVSSKSDYLAKHEEADKKMEVSNVAGAAAPMAAKSRAAIESTAPQPLNGIDSFKVYIENNLVNPHPENTGEEVVIITFIVRTDSSIADLKVIESPGQEYSKEAKRLLRNGPVWKPATVNGNAVEEPYRLQIRFK